MRAVYLKELRSYFTTPLGYVFMAFMLVLFGIYFMLYGLIYQNSDYSYVLDAVTLLILFALPLLTMRMFSEEMKNKTDQLLFTSPIKIWKIVMGKYLAALTLFTLALVITMLQPIVLSALGGSVPIQKVAGGYIGFFLYGCCFTAIGMLISSMTENQLVAAIASIGVFMLIFLLDGIATMLPTSRAFALGAVIIVALIVAFLIYRAIRDIYVTSIVAVVCIGAAVLLFFFVPSVYDNLLVNVADWCSLVTRYSDFYTGVFDFSNVVFYASFTVFVVFLTMQVIEKRRWS